MRSIIKHSVKILGTGSYFPKSIITNNDINCGQTKINLPNNAWITNKLGIKQRHKTSDEKTSDLGFKSAIRALDNANLNIDDINLIITVTSSPDRISPSTACIIQEKLCPTKNIPSFDLNAVCSGFVYTMDVSTQLLNKYNNILIIASETYSTFTDYNDKNCVFFGDGAASVIISKGTTGWYYGNIFADGTGKENFTVKHGNPFSMNGKAVYETGIKVLPQAILQTLQDLNMDISEIDYLVPHQPSCHILYKTADLIGLPKEKILMNMDRRANTAGASIPTVLDELLQYKSISNSSNILFACVGSGWTWGAGVLHYEK